MREGRRPALVDDHVRSGRVCELVRGEDRADDRDRDQGRQDAEPEDGEAVLAELAPRQLELADRLQADL